MKERIHTLRMRSKLLGIYARLSNTWDKEAKALKLLQRTRDELFYTIQAYNMLRMGV